MKSRFKADGAGFVRAVVIRADGTRHDLGVISRTASTPWGRAWWRLVGRRLAARRTARFNRTQKELQTP